MCKKRLKKSLEKLKCSFKIDIKLTNEELEDQLNMNKD